MGYRFWKFTSYTGRSQKCSIFNGFQCSIWVWHYQIHSDRVATGSFDKTAKLWNTETGQLIYTFAGHQNEVVTVAFDPHKSLLATGSMDQPAKLWDLETGKEHSTLKGHEG